MKKIIFLLITIISFQFSSCKKEEKKETVKTEKEATFSVEKALNTINFTAYKTTDKVGVKGQFKKVNVIANGKGNSIKEAINNTEFSIPVSSIFTKDESRDFKIRKFFFGVMDKTSLLSGKLILEDDSKGTAEIIMNGVTEKLSFEYKIEGKTFTMNAVMNLNNWKAESALNSLNEACKELHKGADGVSKTWNEVAINITSTF